MPRNADEKEQKKKIIVKGQKIEKNKTTKLNKKEEKKIQDKKAPKIENKSVQNKAIENIKSFISKVIEMQEKVKRDEEEEKKLKRAQKKEIAEDENADSPKHLLEYYDLPFRYNETIVRILAQTPKRLFVYWDIANKDKQTYLNAFGENFFQDTYPVLLVHNENKDNTYEVAINDFVNSWYLDISNPRDKYTIQLGRKFKFDRKPGINPEIQENDIDLKNDYLFIAMSNKLEVPNDHILFEEFKPYVMYRNVKTKQEEIKDLTNTIFKNKLKTRYQELYKGEIDGETFDMLNPSSIGTSSSITK